MLHLVNMKNLLKLKNLNETPFRKEVLSIFEKFPQAISIHDIEAELSSFNRVTLYRTMKAFVDKGIVHEIVLAGDETKYAICKDTCSSQEHNHQHVHFKCTKCESVLCVEVAEFPKVNLPAYQIDQLEIQASGVCKKCNA
jgi:Fur family ferric uptake transcriptional regulator